MATARPGYGCADAAEHSGLPPPLSGRLTACLVDDSAALGACRSAARSWRALLCSPSTLDELWRRDLDHKRRSDAWRSLLLGGLSEESREAQSYQNLCETPCSYDALIQRDIGRTLPQEELFRDGPKGKGQSALFRLLRALAVHLWDIGYVQSLNFIVATLICVFPDDETLVFHCAQALLFRHSLADFYRPRFPKLGVTVWQFDRILEAFMPDIAKALAGHGVTAEYYAMQWFLTLFASDLPQATVRRVWDRFLIAGWRVIVQVGLALLREVGDTILLLDTCELLTFLKRFVRVRRFDAERLLESAAGFAVTHQMLSQLEAAYSSGGRSRAGVKLVVDEPSDMAGAKPGWALDQVDADEAAPEAVPSPSGTPSSGAGSKGQGTVLPFLLHNLDTGETTIMEEEWATFQRGEKDPAIGDAHGAPGRRCQAAPPEASSAAAHGTPASSSGPCSGGNFWSQSRQHQALRKLGKVP